MTVQNNRLVKTIILSGHLIVFWLRKENCKISKTTSTCCLVFTRVHAKFKRRSLVAFVTSSGEEIRCVFDDI